MKPIVTGIKDKEFVHEVIPKIISSVLLEKLSTPKYLPSVQQMSEYIGKYYGVNLKVLCIAIKSYLSISEQQNGSHNIALDENRLVDNTSYSVGFIARIIDYGNMDIKGIDLFKSTFDKVEKSLTEVYKLYLKGGFR